MHKEKGKTGSWKSPAQNTIDSPELRRALNGRLDTEQDNTAANMRQKGKMRKEGTGRGKMHKEEGKTGSWKSPAQNTIDSPELRRAQNSRYGTHSTQQRNRKAINKYFNKNERFICIIEKKCVTLQKISTRYTNTIFDELLRNKRSNAKTEKQSYHCTGRVDESATARVLRTMLVSHR